MIEKDLNKSEESINVHEVSDEKSESSVIELEEKKDVNPAPRTRTRAVKVADQNEIIAEVNVEETAAPTHQKVETMSDSEKDKAKLAKAKKKEKAKKEKKKAKAKDKKAKDKAKARKTKQKAKAKEKAKKAKIKAKKKERAKKKSKAKKRK